MCQGTGFKKAADSFYVVFCSTGQSFITEVSLRAGVIHCTFVRTLLSYANT